MRDFASHVDASRASTRLLHWVLSSPVIVASSPLTANGRMIRSLLGKGVGAGVTKTITPMADTATSGARWVGEHLFNTDGYSRLSVEQWVKELEPLRGRPVIANIFAETPGDLADVACRIAEAGVEVFELGLSCPTKGADPVCFHPDRMAACVTAVRRALPRVGLLVKVQWEPSEARYRALIRLVGEAGGDGVSCCDSFPALLDVYERNGGPERCEQGGMSGPVFRPLVRRAIRAMADERPDLSIVAIGGVESGADVASYMRAGSSAVQVCTAIMRNGDSWVPDLVADADRALGAEVVV